MTAPMDMDAETLWTLASEHMNESGLPYLAEAERRFWRLLLEVKGIDLDELMRSSVSEES